MDVDDVKMASVTCGDKAIKPIQTRCSATVGDRGCSEFGLACELVHVFLVDRCGFSGSKVRLAGIVGFVGATCSVSRLAGGRYWVEGRLTRIDTSSHSLWH